MSVSASAENLTSTKSCDGGSMCLELALEGERLCKAGDCRAGVAFFRAAIQAGTDDLRTLSAIYSQLGNAYFYLGDYAAAMQYHKHDLTLARTMGDKLGEAKSSGNLGNTLKVMGRFAEAITCCKRHLELAQQLGDKLSEARALYNLGNVYHAQGKQLGRVGHGDPGHFPPQVRDSLHSALHYYKENLELMRSLGDEAACGRACGNLGNTCYLLGDFAQAIVYHTERLRIAKLYNDKAAERRANSNLANSHIFLGQLENAAQHYQQTLSLAMELKDAAVEAQACYSLGNTYTLLRDYQMAEEYHFRHLKAAQVLQDRVGEGRACWSLGNAYAALGDHEKALYYAKKHAAISKELGDSLGTATAELNVSDLRKVLGLTGECEAPTSAPTALSNATEAPFSSLRLRRQSMEQLSLIQHTPDSKNQGAAVDRDKEDSPESFFDLLSRCQSERMDDQRATFNKENLCGKNGDHKLQRSASAAARHSTVISNKTATMERPSEQPSKASNKPDEELLDMIARVQGSRLEEQRTELPRRPAEEKAVTLPDDDFFSLVVRVQGGRMDDQRATIPLQENRQKKQSGSGTN